MIDTDGSKSLIYTKGYLVYLQVSPKGDPSWRNELGGFVVDVTQEGDYCILEVVSHDFWLRNREVFKSYTGQTVSSILQDLVTDLTPLIWDSALVSVLNDETITQTWKGERLDVVIAELAKISGDEEYGATDDRKFFFRQRETTRSPRDFTDGEYTVANFPHKQKDEPNKVTVYYGEPPNTGIVSVQDLAAQQALADRIGASEPVVLEASRNYPEVDNEDAARRKAYALLDGKAALLIGTIETWDGYDVDPGMITLVEVPESGINTDFRVAEIKYMILANKTIIKVAENSEGVIDKLIELSTETVRIDLKQADLAGTKVEVVDLQQGIGIEGTVKIWKMMMGANGLIWGETYKGWGDPDIGGGYWGDQRGNKVQVVP